MAYKVTNTETGQELRFANLRTAEQYVRRYGGGSEQWTFTEVANRDPAYKQLSHLLPEHEPMRRSERRTHG